MKGRSGLVVCGLALCLAMPAAAQDRSHGPAGAHNPAVTGFGRSVLGRPAPDRPARLSAQGPRIRFTNDSIIREDGSPGDRRSVVGSLPLVGPLAAEVGLFSVTGATVKERELKRTDPMADIQPRRSRVAAVGLRMSF